MQHIIGAEPIEFDDEMTDEELERQVRADLAAGRIDSHSSGWTCQVSPDGNSVACGPRHPRPPREPSYEEVMLIRQETAGEEDQSVAGWDQGA